MSIIVDEIIEVWIPGTGAFDWIPLGSELTKEYNTFYSTKTETTHFIMREDGVHCFKRDDELIAVSPDYKK